MLATSKHTSFITLARPKAYFYTQLKGYRFSFNGQERDDEIAGAGNIMTAEFWEYDTRLGRRWNVDPRHFAWESSYSVMGDNPIVRNDKKGDKWKDGNDKKMASELDRKLEKRSKGLSKEANKYDKKADSYKDNDIEKYNEYKSLANLAREGVIEMNNARNELVKMGCEDVEQEFHFEAIDPESDNIANTYMDKSGIINMQYFAWDDASAIHEGNHGYQYFTEKMKFTTEGTEFGDIHDEVRAYKRQFLFDPGSVSTIKLDNGETIKTYQRITPEIIHRIVTEDKEGNKILPYLNDSNYDLPMLKDPSL